MSIIPYQDGNFLVKKNDIIFSEGQNAQSVNILLQGKVDVLVSPFEEYDGLHEEEIIKNSFKIFSLEQNTFMGVNDLFLSRKYSLSYRASEDSGIYAFIVQNSGQLKNLMSGKKDYAAYMIASVATSIDCCCSALNKAQGLARSLRILTDNLAVFFWVMKEKFGFTCSPSGRFFRDGLDSLQKMRDRNFSFPEGFDPAFFEKDLSDVMDTEYAGSDEFNNTKTDYYKRLSGIPVELRKGFFGADLVIAEYHCRDASEALEGILSPMKDAFREVAECFRRLYTHGGECILSEYAGAAAEAGRSGADASVLIKTVEYIIGKIKEVAAIYRNEYANQTEIDVSGLDGMYDFARGMRNDVFEKEISPCSGQIEVKGGGESIPEELRDSARRIVEYSGVPAERGDMFLLNLESFRRLRDRLSSDEGARNIRSNIASVFFDIYEGVFKKVIEEKNTSRLYHMFLNFAYVDERLLKPQHTLALYKLADMPAFSGDCPVYSMRDWLMKIHAREKDPSINDFGMDYFDTFREMKRRKEVTDKDKQEYDNDMAGRLHYEVHNMFKINQKLCHGQISTYFPVLHDEMITKDLSKAIVTPERINESIKKILEADFSAFHREISYRNAERGIEKEFIMKSVLPDCILMPIFGTRAAMWQELTGRLRSTSGRFIFPVFTSEDLDDFVLKVVGNFRWELCRTMMGVSWNDVSQKSLTSEYTDYIQFYKKNKDLSEEAKEKIKVQTQKYRNMMRDVFTADYETWIKCESKGIIRLNKVVRGILYRYCPFPKATREALGRQPMFSDMAAQFNNLRSKQAREIESHYYGKFTKSGAPLDPELEENLKFYKEM